MANHSDDESVGAPENFHITTENDDDGSHWSSYQVKCPLCNYSRKSFHCCYCIRDGNFVHSSHHLVERFAEKQLKYKNLKSVHRAQQTTCLQLLHNRKLSEDLQFAIKQKKDNIQLLKKLIDERKRNTSLLTDRCQKLIISNGYTRKQVPQYVKKCQQFADYIVRTDDRNSKQSLKKTKLYDELKQCRTKNIQKLIKYIFPLSQRVSKTETQMPINVNTATNATTNKGSTAYIMQHIDSSTEKNVSDLGGSATAETLNALADATHTTYVRGKWVLQDSRGELQHVIVAPSLPENGDYSAYNDWVATTKDGVPNPPGASEAMTSSNCAYRISAALTYTTQLVHLLSYYLDVRLPYKVNYSDFCKKELNEQSFSRKVARLNTNILYLCYTQRVKLSTLSPSYTLGNICKLLDLDHSNLGCISAVDTSDGFTGFSNDQLFQNLLTGSTDSGSDDEDEGTLPTEWEAVLHPQPQTNTDVLFPPNMQNTQQTASMAGGLVTSAVQSVASIWRVFTTGNRN